MESVQVILWSLWNTKPGLNFQLLLLLVALEYGKADGL